MGRSSALQQRCASEWRCIAGAMVFLPALKSGEELQDTWKRLNDSMEKCFICIFEIFFYEN
jgi:hypothetical protein